MPIHSGYENTIKTETINLKAMAITIHIAYFPDVITPTVDKFDIITINSKTPTPETSSGRTVTGMTFVS